MKSPLLRSLSVSTILIGLFWGMGSFQGRSYSQFGSSGNPSLGSSLVTSIAPAHAASSGTTIMASSILSNGMQQIVLFDQPKQTLAVYHVEPSSGDIQLKSVRRLDADLALQEFNLSEPTPSTIRKNVR
jgi:hypothetical protein